MVARIETVRRLVDRLQAEKTRGLRWPELRMGVVTAVDVSTVPYMVTLILAADTDFPVVGVPVLAGYYPTVNDVVWVFKNGSDLIVAGSLGPARRPGRDPRCKIYKSGNQSLTNNTYEALTFGVEDYDSHGMHSTSLNTSRITPTRAGLYLIQGVVEFAADGTGHRDVKTTKNGGTNPIAAQLLPAVSGTVTMVEIVGWEDANGTTDYFELYARHNITGGGALNAVGGAVTNTHFGAMWVAEDKTSA